MDCQLPETLCSITRRGKHLLYSVPDGVVIGNRAKILGNAKGAPDLDIRGEHGQIVAPPSVHYSGHVYQWGPKLPIATLPDAVVDWLLKPTAPIVQRPRVEGLSRDTAYFRAAKYLAHCPPAISGQGGHTDTFVTCKKLLGNFPELTESDAWELICRWNDGCQPPWSERELRHKFNEARRFVGAA